IVAGLPVGDDAVAAVGAELTVGATPTVGAVVAGAQVAGLVGGVDGAVPAEGRPGAVGVAGTVGPVVDAVVTGLARVHGGVATAQAARRPHHRALVARLDG